eukprot:scaffold7723_cov35-Cyclotella_meneghiniana.AAC.3
MSYLRTEHAPLYTLLACVLWDEKYRGRFVSFATAKSICDVMAPDDYITGKNSLSTALKCGDDAIDWPVFGSLSPEEKTAIEYADGTKLVIRKNLRCGKNGRANVVSCFGPDHAVPELRGSDQLMAFAAGDRDSIESMNHSRRGHVHAQNQPTLHLPPPRERVQKIWALDSLRKEDEKKRRKQRERRRRQREEQSSTQQTQQSPAREEQQQTQPVKSRKQYKIQKVEGKKRLMMLSQWMDWKVNEIEKARESLGDEKMKEIISTLSRDKKISTDENEEKIKQFESAANSQHERTIDSKHLADITCWMEGSLVFSYFTKTNGAWDFLLAEIKHRDIKRPKQIERGAKNKPKKTVRIKEWTDLKEAELVILLKEHERAARPLAQRRRESLF